MTPEARGWARARPLRVAFLVENKDHGQTTLDGLFADSYSRWGGRFSLVVPCIDGRILASFWPWLETYDPDVIYSYVDLDQGEVLRIHERIYPSEYIWHDPVDGDRHDVFAYKPNYRFEPLSCLSVIFTAARHSPSHGASTLRILDSWHGAEVSPFLADNFGTYWRSMGAGMLPSDARGAARLLTLVPSEALGGRHYGMGQDFETIPDDLAALTAFSDDRATSLAQASAWFAQRLEVQSHPWSSAFSLVVGSSFEDRVLFWNARHLIPAWLDRDVVTLRVAEEQLADPAFLQQLGILLGRRNHVGSGTGGPPTVTIRSISLSEAALADAAARVKGVVRGSFISAARVGPLDATVPDTRSLGAAREKVLFPGTLSHHPGWSAFTWLGARAQPPELAPVHLSDVPFRQRFAMGCWAVDYLLEREGAAAGDGANRSLLLLPRRWRMASAFKIERGGDRPPFMPPRPRRGRDGCLTTFVTAEAPVTAIHVPDPRSAITRALSADGRGAGHLMRHKVAYPACRCAWAAASNEAAYLTGVLGMAGGLSAAGSFLLHLFLRTQLEKLGASSDAGSHDLQPILSSLGKRARRDQSFDLSASDDRGALAALVAREARKMRAPQAFLRLSQLQTAWREHRQAYWAREGGQLSIGME